jgi:predicted enzyme related to lactoylglutathione lyase
LPIAGTTLSGGVYHKLVMSQPNNYPYLVTWFEIPAAELDRAAKFYSDVLGVSMKVDQIGPERLSVFPHQKPSVGGCLTVGGRPAAK